MIIFGWGGGRPKDFGAAVASTCPRCNRQTMFHYFKSTKYFSLFFIPLIPYNTRHLLLCAVCTQGTSLTPEQAKRAKALAVSYSAWRQKSITDAEYSAQVEQFWGIYTPLEVGQRSGAAAIEVPQKDVDHGGSDYGAALQRLRSKDGDASTNNSTAPSADAAASQSMPVSPPDTGIEVRYDTTPWSPEEFAAIRTELEARGVPFTVEQGELVVEKRYEPLVDRVTESLVASAAIENDKN